jgi:hypothetical protein
MYDRGSWEQLWNSHAPVAPEKWATIDLPTQTEVPGIDLEVINFHRVLLGTFHAKFLVVDRKVALLNSNNIQGELSLLVLCDRSLTFRPPQSRTHVTFRRTGS